MNPEYTIENLKFLFSLDGSLLSTMFILLSKIILPFDFVIIAILSFSKNGEILKGRLFNVMFINVNLLLALVVQINTPYIYPFLPNIIINSLSGGMVSYFLLTLLFLSCTSLLFFISCLLLLHFFKKTTTTWLGKFFKFYFIIYTLSLLATMLFLSNIKLANKIHFAFTERRIDLNSLSPELNILIWLKYTTLLTAVLYFVFIISVGLNKKNAIEEAQETIDKKRYFQYLIFFIYFLIYVLFDNFFK